MAGIDNEALIALAQDRIEAALAMTRKLVQMDTQTPPSATGPICEVIADSLRDLPDVTLDVAESVAPVVNLVARLSGGEPGPRLVLSGHVDTYPIGDPAAWTCNPLGGDIIDGRLYGRGSADMKGGVASLIETFRLFALHLRPFPGEIVLALAGDEERMGELGTQWLIDHDESVRADGVIVADVGSPRSVRLGEKGMIWIDVEAKGVQSHGAHVHAGRNAIDTLCAALQDLKSLEEMPVTCPDDPRRVMDEAASIAGADGPDARETMKRITVNIGTIAGGDSPNLVPAFAKAGLDIRIPLGIGVEEVEAAIAECLGRYPDVSWSVTRRYEPTWTSAESPIAEACLKAARTVMVEGVHADMRVGGSDARLLRRSGMDTVVLGLTPRNLGAADESMDVAEMKDLLAIHVLTTRNFLYGQPR